jgi:hypothetical protein
MEDNFQIQVFDDNDNKPLKILMKTITEKCFVEHV